jgi:regulatory protein
MAYTPPLKYDPITDPKKLYNRALYWLSKRDYSVADFVKKLDKVCENAEMKDALVVQLIENDWLSEKRYIKAFIRSKISAGLGPFRITNDLKQHGVKSNDAELALEQFDTDWFEQARETYERKYGNSPFTNSDSKKNKNSQELYKEKAKRFRYMQYRGFSIDQINYAIAPSDD